MPQVPLRFLADESCDLVVVRAMRTDGYDVLAVIEIAVSPRNGVFSRSMVRHKAPLTARLVRDILRMPEPIL